MFSYISTQLQEAIILLIIIFITQQVLPNGYGMALNIPITMPGKQPVMAMLIQPIIDPLLTNTSSPDLHIQAVSPAKNTGIVISTAINGTTDIDGNARVINNKISKGAHAVN